VYPRPGQRLAPSLLRDVLDQPIPPELQFRDALRDKRLCDLDADTTRDCNEHQLVVLAQEVVDAVRRAIPSLPWDVLERCPDVPRAVDLRNLELGMRAFNCLGREGLDPDIRGLESRSIGQLLEMHGFGAGCLVDLLTALEAAADLKSEDEVEGEDGAGLLEELEAAADLKSEDEVDLTVPEYSPALAATAVAFRSALRLADKVDAAAMQAELLGQELDISASDPRLGPELRTGPLGFYSGQTLSELAAAVRNRSTNEGWSEHALLEGFERLSDKVERLASLSLDEELHEFASLAGAQRNTRIVLRRNGWDGGPRQTLEETGQAFGVTRERVRQICARVTRAINGGRPYAPALDRALEAIYALLPAGKVDIEHALVDQGIVSSQLDLSGIEMAARVLGRGASLSIVGSGIMTDDAESTREASVVVRAAHKAVSRWGVATHDDVAVSASDLGQDPVGSELVVRVLTACPGYRLLDAEAGWFTMLSQRSSLRSRMRKILSVTSPISVAELRAGLGRHYRVQGFAPPSRVLLALCELLPGYRVEGSTVFAEPALDWRAVLSGVERQMVGVLKEHGPVMSRIDYEELCVARGVGKSTFYVYLDYSPVLHRYARGVYGLRGADVPAGLVEMVQPAKIRKGRVLVDYGWTKDRQVFCHYRVSAPMISSGVFSAPSSMKSFLYGQFAVESPDGGRFGTITVAESGTWGLSPFFRRRGGEPGDYLLIVFDLSRHVAVIRLGDESLKDRVLQDVAS